MQVGDKVEVVRVLYASAATINALKKKKGTIVAMLPNWLPMPITVNIAGKQIRFEHEELRRV